MWGIEECNEIIMLGSKHMGRVCGFDMMDAQNY